MRYAMRTGPTSAILPSSAWYQFACAAAIAGHEQDAMQNLRNAVSRGYQDLGSLASEEDLRTVRNDPQFRELLAALKKQAAPTRS